MLKMYDDPDFVHRVAEMVTEYNLKQIDLVVQAGLDVLVVEDDIATTQAPMISPDQFTTFINPYNRKLIDPYNRKLIDRAHELGLMVVRHSDGNIWSLMDVLLSSACYPTLMVLRPP